MAARFEDYSGPQPKCGYEYVRLMGLPYHISAEGLKYHLELMDPTLKPESDDMVFFTTAERSNFGKKSGVCLVAFSKRSQRDQAVVSYDKRYIGSR